MRFLYSLCVGFLWLFFIAVLYKMNIKPSIDTQILSLAIVMAGVLDSSD